MLVINEKSNSVQYILMVLEITDRYRQLGRCSICEKYDKKCKKIMNEVKL